jgi:NADH-quinone oxidoreductase subunit N
MLMAVSAMMVILNAPAQSGMSTDERITSAAYSIHGLLYYLAVYFFMNLGAFAIAALVRNQTYSEEVADYAGLAWQAPVLAVGMLFCMFSLIGMPPFGGFVGKFMVFASVVDAAKFHPVMWFVLAAGVANTVFSLFYYLRVLRFMFLVPPAEGARPVAVPLFSDGGLYVLLVTAPVFGLMIFVDWLSNTVQGVAKSLFL